MGERGFESELSKAQKNEPFSVPVLYYLESSGDTQLPRLNVFRPKFDLLESIQTGNTFFQAIHEPSREVVI